MLDRDWGVEADPHRQKFSVTSVGVVFDQWGVKPPNPPQIEHWSMCWFLHLNLVMDNFVCYCAYVL